MTDDYKYGSAIPGANKAQGDTGIGYDKPSAFDGNLGSMYVRDPENISSMYLTVDQNQQFRFHAAGKPVSKCRRFLLHPAVALAIGYLLGLITALVAK